jgi:signal transduction histidine kinase
MFGTNQDITDRKNAEETLQHQNKELKKTNEELDRFVYSASHDLRAPLTSLLGLIGIVEMEAESDNVLQERLDMMKRTVHRLDSFIADILDYSRNSRTGINYEPICFETKIKEIEELAKHLNDGTHKCKLVVELDLQSTFYSDRRRIWMLLNNLVSNAINYSDLEKESCYCKISIKTNEQEAVIKIEDNGKGIAAKDIERIFEMFYRASGKSRGSGLGLYIVKETVEKLNGTISVTSIPAPDEKSGTQFLITLPNNKPKE